MEPSRPHRELGGTQQGQSPPREGAVKGGEELRRPEVAAAVLNVFISAEAGEGWEPANGIWRDAPAGSSAKSSGVGENRQDPRGRSGGARRGGAGGRQGSLLAWEKHHFSGLPHTVSAPSAPPLPCARTLQEGRCPLPVQGSGASSALSPLSPRHHSPVARGCQWPGHGQGWTLPPLCPWEPGEEGRGGRWPCDTQQERRRDASPGAVLPTRPRHLLRGAGGEQGPAPALGSASRKLRS